jgi:predicted secreted protein
MSIAGGIVIYVIVWWVVFFAVLPWGVKGRWESEDDGVIGAEPGAPVTPDLKRKALITSAIALGLWVVIAAIIVSGVIDFRE